MKTSLDDTPHARTLRRKLLGWYDAHGRMLPWRTQPTLYRTVISEFMLQQTQVTTVLPYFERWMEKFPDFPALARASENEVTKAWEGLGYYSRARNLHKLSRIIAERERPPDSYEQWLQMPGVGPYTAAAIASIAHHEARAVIDGNVIRVLARLQADATRYPGSAAASRAYEPQARALLDPDRPGDYNQALMELGALVCRPRKPACLLCPLQSLCRARAEGNPEAYPQRAPRKIHQRRVARCIAVRSDQNRTEILLEKIPKTARRLAGQYQIPELPDHALPPTMKPILVKTRGISNERITESIYPPPPGFTDTITSANLHWVDADHLHTLTIPGPHRRWIQQLLKS